MSSPIIKLAGKNPRNHKTLVHSTAFKTNKPSLQTENNPIGKVKKDHKLEVKYLQARDPKIVEKRPKKRKMGKEYEQRSS